MTNVQDQSHQIATSTEQQTVVAEDINTQFFAISNVFNDTATIHYIPADNPHDLSDLPRLINKIIAQFKD